MNEYPVPAIGRGPHRRSAEVARIVSSYVQSGVSRSEFCGQHGLPMSTLTRYYRRAGQHEAVAFKPVAHNDVELPLARVEFLDKPAKHAVQQAALQVDLAGGRRICVPCGFDAAALRRVIAVLEQA